MRKSLLFCVSALMSFTLSFTLWGCGRGEAPPPVYYSMQVHNSDCGGDLVVFKETVWTAKKCAELVAHYGQCTPWFSYGYGNCKCWKKSPECLKTGLFISTHGKSLYLWESKPRNLSALTRRQIDQCKSDGPCDGQWTTIGQSRHCVRNPLGTPSSIDYFSSEENDNRCKCAGWKLEADVGELKITRQELFYRYFDELRKAAAKTPAGMPRGHSRNERARVFVEAADQFCPMIRWSESSYGLKNSSLYKERPIYVYFSVQQVDSDGAHSTASLAKAAAGKRMAALFAVPAAVVFAICIATRRSRPAKSGRLLLGDGNGEQSSEELTDALPHESHCHPHLSA